MLSCYSCVQLFVTPYTLAHQDPLSMGFFLQEYWSRLPCPPPGDIPDPGIKPVSPASPAFQVDSLPAESSGKPIYIQLYKKRYYISTYHIYISIISKYIDV